MTFADAVARCGLIAILRGIAPDECQSVVGAIADAGFTIVEVPLNSPDPFRSIELLARRFGKALAVGAGTVLTAEDVRRVRDSGGVLCVSPDCNATVIEACGAHGLEPLPGVFTPTEAFSAFRAGARHLKLFPADCASPRTVRAWGAVLPKEVRLYAVGGVSPENMKEWREAGISGFGIGSNLYKAGASVSDVAAAATRFAKAWRDMMEG